MRAQQDEAGVPRTQDGGDKEPDEDPGGQRGPGGGVGGGEGCSGHPYWSSGGRVL